MNANLELFLPPVDASMDQPPSPLDSEAPVDETSFSELLDRELDDEALATLLGFPASLPSKRTAPMGTETPTELRPPAAIAPGPVNSQPVARPAAQPAAQIGLEETGEATAAPLAARSPEQNGIERQPLPIPEGRPDTVRPEAAESVTRLPRAPEPVTTGPGAAATLETIGRGLASTAPETNAAAAGTTTLGSAVARSNPEERTSQRLTRSPVATKVEAESTVLAAAVREAPEAREASRSPRGPAPAIDVSPPVEASKATRNPAAPIETRTIREEAGSGSTAPVLEASQRQPVASNTTPVAGQGVAPIAVANAPAQAIAAAPEVVDTPATRFPAGPVEEIPARIEWLAQRGGGVARVELDPPHLGRVEMIVRMRGSDVEVVISASEPAAQAAVQAQRAQLVENLAARDLRLTHLDVGHSGDDSPQRDAGTGSRTADDGSGTPGQHGARRGPETAIGDRTDEIAPTVTRTTTDSRINLHA